LTTAAAGTKSPLLTSQPLSALLCFRNINDRHASEVLDSDIYIQHPKDSQFTHEKAKLEKRHTFAHLQHTGCISVCAPLLCS
jgi:hypothetical protein